MMSKLAERTKQLVHESRALSFCLGDPELSPGCLAYWMLHDGSLASELGLPATHIHSELLRAARESALLDKVTIGPKVWEFVDAAAERHGVPVEPAELLHTLLESSEVRESLRGMGAPKGRRASDRERPKRTVPVSREASPQPLPSALSALGYLLGEDDPGRQLVGRDDLLVDVMAGLLTESCSNVMLIGEAGTGKTAVVEELARRLRSQGQSTPEELRGCRIFALNPNALNAGTKYAGTLEGRVQQLIEALCADRSLILFVDEFHSLVGMGRLSDQRGHSVLDALKPHLASGRLRVIGATTEKEWAKHVEPDQALVRRFRLVRVPSPSPEELDEILRQCAERMQERTGVQIAPALVARVKSLAGDHIPGMSEPARSLSVLDQAVALCRAVGGDSHERTLTLSDVERAVEARINAPIHGGSIDMARLKSCLATVVGQGEATGLIYQEVAKALGPFAPEQGPRFSVLLCGPTGVGKTMTAKALAEGLFGDSSRLLRFDMSEFSGGRMGVSALIGSAPGFVNSDEGGRLTNALIANPHCVLLLDEIEKADPLVWNLLLQALDEGVLTDARGHVASFRHCYVVMTTNAGVMERRRSVGFVEDAARGAETRVAVEALKQGGFPPELLGRISAIIPYRSLEAEDYSVIADRELDRIGAKLSEEGRTLKLNDPSLPAKRAVEWANSGLGARDVIRGIQRLIMDPVSRLVGENPELWSDCKEVRVERLPSSEETPAPDWITDPDGTVALVI